MSSSTNGDDDKVVVFPATPEQRRQLLRAKQEAEQKRLAHLFVDETASGQGLFHTPDGEAFADLIVAGVRETWAIKSKKFRAEYIRYLQRQFDHMINESAPLAAIFKLALGKSAVNAMIDEFEMKAMTSTVEREVRVRVASDADHLYIDLGDPEWHAVRITAAGWSVIQSPLPARRSQPQSLDRRNPRVGGVGRADARRRPALVRVPEVQPALQASVPA